MVYFHMHLILLDIQYNKHMDFHSPKIENI